MKGVEWYCNDVSGLPKADVSLFKLECWPIEGINQWRAFARLGQWLHRSDNACSSVDDVKLDAERLLKEWLEDIAIWNRNMMLRVGMNPEDCNADRR
jgi:hypothetical protein